MKTLGAVGRCVVVEKGKREKPSWLGMSTVVDGAHLEAACAVVWQNAPCVFTR